MDQNYDELIEALTVERLLENPRHGLYGGYGGNAHRYDFKSWYWGTYYKPGVPYDIAYRNKDGKYHRIHGPAYTSPKYQVQEWYKEGVRHREDGPAIIHKDTKVWLKDGKLHRLDGPAIEDPAGPKQYWIDGQRLPPKEYKKEIARRKRKGLIKCPPISTTSS